MDSSSCECFPNLEEMKKIPSSDAELLTTSSNAFTPAEAGVLPSTVVKVDDEGVVSKLLEGFVVVAVHVSCVDEERRGLDAG